jgi:hypothetical protein
MSAKHALDQRFTGLHPQVFGGLQLGGMGRHEHRGHQLTSFFPYRNLYRDAMPFLKRVAAHPMPA